MEALKARTTAEWLEIFDRCDVPAMPYHTLDTLLEDPHLKDAGFFELKDHPTEGRTRVMRPPNKWSSGVRREWNPAPKLGQQSVEILREIGCTDAEIDAMVASGVTLDGRIGKP
jgi:crotonobetainyl-CoA:carnitine CoA-transferase CaiB-like acyl-CoA transferase